MKIINSLNGQVGESAWTKSPLAHMANETEVQDGEHTRAWIRQITLSEDGLLISGGGAQVGIPLAELLRLAETADDRLKVPAGSAPALHPVKA